MTEVKQAGKLVLRRGVMMGNEEAGGWEAPSCPTSSPGGPAPPQPPVQSITPGVWGFISLLPAGIGAGHAKEVNAKGTSCRKGAL